MSSRPVEGLAVFPRQLEARSGPCPDRIDSLIEAASHSAAEPDKSALTSTWAPSVLAGSSSEKLHVEESAVVGQEFEGRSGRTRFEVEAKSLCSPSLLCLHSAWQSHRDRKRHGRPSRRLTLNISRVRKVDQDSRQWHSLVFRRRGDAPHAAARSRSSASASSSALTRNTSLTPPGADNAGRCSRVAVRLKARKDRPGMSSSSTTMR